MWHWWMRRRDGAARQQRGRVRGVAPSGWNNEWKDERRKTFDDDDDDVDGDMMNVNRMVCYPLECVNE